MLCSTPSAVTVNQSLIPVVAFPVRALRFLSKARLRTWPPGSTVAAESLADATVELFVTAGTLFSPVVNETTSLPAPSASALAPAAEAS